MASFSIIENFEVKYDDDFLAIADNLKPNLLQTVASPKRLIQIGYDEKQDINITGEEDIGQLKVKALKRDDSVIIDFGDHYVGYLTLDLKADGAHPDSPAYLYLRFAEREDELLQKVEDYKGWLSRSWIQEEYLHVDTVEGKFEMLRRYAFRYLYIKVIDVSPKYNLLINDISVRAVSAVKMSDVQPINSGDELLDAIDKVSIRTLHECMQDVFEDGPKRDRRMWLGDTRLQALTNYYTFQNADLPRRALYLFGGMTFNEGKIASCLFTSPKNAPDDTYLFDFACLYTPTLKEYYDFTNDERTLRDLYPVAMRQLDILIDDLDENFLVKDKSGEFWIHIDWGDDFNKACAAQGVLIYSMEYAVQLAEIIGDTERVERYQNVIQKLKQAAYDNYFDPQEKLFVSGPDKQLSWANQVWMALAKVLDEQETKDLLIRTIHHDPRVRMVTPYMYHYFVEALLQVGETERAIDIIKRYWGEMVHNGADTFYELYNPYNKNESPYGSVILNSFCHAWSCTPAYFFRKYKLF